MKVTHRADKTIASFFLTLVFLVAPSYAADSVELNWKKQKESPSKFTLETDKGDFFVDKKENADWARVVTNFTSYSAGLGEIKMTVNTTLLL